jgi:hypothetical protein
MWFGDLSFSGRPMSSQSAFNILVAFPPRAADVPNERRCRHGRGRRAALVDLRIAYLSGISGGICRFAAKQVK